MLKYFIDSETLGFHGVPVILQYAINKGPAIIHNLWLEPVHKTLRVIEDMVDNCVIAHNLVFDWFHVSKIYNLLLQCPDKSVAPLAYSIDQLAAWEFEARNGVCLKPRAAVCTLVLAQKSETQSAAMDRKPMFIRRVPALVADQVARLLEARTVLPDILFARSPAGSPKWRVSQIKDDNTGEIDVNWKDVKLVFNPSNGLKELATFVLGYEPFAKFDEISSEVQYPIEVGYAPYAAILSSPEKGWMFEDKPTWPLLLHDHVNHWATNPDAQAYAVDDIEMLRRLYDHFGAPDDDEDGVISCQVAGVRLQGFEIDLEKLEEQNAISVEIMKTAELNADSPVQVKNYVSCALDPMEALLLAQGCDQKVMNELKEEWTLEKEEGCYCEGNNPVCPRCDGLGHVGPGPMPVLRRLEHIELIRQHSKRLQLFKKLRLAGRFYAGFKIIGAKSGRLSGDHNLNAQGIDSSPEVRDIFTLADKGWVLSAGDYSSQELAIAVTAMNDDDLMTDLETGKSLHGLLGAELFETTYEDIMANKKDGRYGKAKSCIYCMLYGGSYQTMAVNAGVSEKIAEAAFNNFVKKYPQVGNTRKAITERFSAIERGPNGQMIYNEVEHKFIESLFGFRRQFDVEFEIQKTVYDFMREAPVEWRDIPGKIQRSREGKIQSILGAAMSALTGALYSIQNGIIRASNNHIIQSTGRSLTVGLQSAVWKMQPQGIHPFVVKPATIHDELFVVSLPQDVDQISQIVSDTIREQGVTIPLLAMDWNTYANSWANKGDKGGTTFGWVPPEEIVAAA